MSRGAILHLFGWDKKFVLSFRDLIHAHFADGQHRFIVYGLVDQAALPQSMDTVVYGSLLKNIVALSKAMQHAEKIILHGLFSTHLLYILALQPWLLKKCHWVIWGGDLYVHQAEVKDWRWRKNEFFRRLVIQRLGYLLTYIPGDVALARQWYGATGQHQECLMYTSNIFKEIVIPPKRGSVINILVGNSADPTNNHLEVFEKLAAYKNENMMIYCPLSYGGGDGGYAKHISEKGRALFGDRFVALVDFMPFTKYLELLGQIDIAVFAHNRQQGMGNVITLLGLGKKIYMRSDITPWVMFDGLHVKVFDLLILDLIRINYEIQIKNKVIIKNYFSEETLSKKWKIIFES